MNSTLRRGILKRLTDSVELDALVARHPDDTSRPAIVLESGMQLAVYPCVTYRFTGIDPTRQFQPTAAEGGGQSPVQEGRLEIRVYGRDNAGGGLVSKRDDIGEIVKTILNGVRFKIGNISVFEFELMGELPDQPDPANRALYHLLRFRFRFHSL